MSALPPFQQEGLCPISPWQACVPSKAQHRTDPEHTQGGKAQAPGGRRLALAVWGPSQHSICSSSSAQMLSGQGQGEEPPRARQALHHHSSATSPRCALTSASAEDACISHKGINGEKGEKERNAKYCHTLSNNHFYNLFALLINYGDLKSLKVSFICVRIIYLRQTHGFYLRFLSSECVTVLLVHDVGEPGVWGWWYFPGNTGILRHGRLYLGSAGGLEKQAICFSYPATDTSPSHLPFWHLYTQCISPMRIWTLKSVKTSQQKNGMKETKTFLMKDYSRATQIKSLLTTAIRNPFRMSTKHPRDQVQAGQLWVLQWTQPQHHWTAGRMPGSLHPSQFGGKDHLG